MSGPASLRAIFVAVALGAIAAWSIPALAQKGDQSAAADALFRQAVALAKQKKFAEAIEKFQASYSLDPARGTLQGLALAEEKAGRVASASGHYRELVDLSHEAHDAAREKAAKKRVAELEPRVPHLSIALSAEKTGTEVMLDGSVLPKGALATPLPVDPGEHEVSARAGDGSHFSAKVSFAEGDKKDVLVRWEASSEGVNTTLAPPPSPSEPPPTPVAPVPERPRETQSSKGKPLRTIGLVSGGVGLVVLGVGGYMYLKANSDISDIDAKCPNRSCNDPGLVQDGNDARDRRSLGRIAMLGGGVVLAAGVTLFVIGSSGKEPATTVSAWAGPGSFGIVARTP